MLMISDEWRDKIDVELSKIEKEYDVTVVFACESGSRAWGFPSQDSDYDVRFIYVHKQDRYLDLEDHRDVIEKPINDLLDISGWDVKKAIKLLRKSNPGLLEWRCSPIIYKEHFAFHYMSDLIDRSFNHRSSILHYYHMAMTNKKQWLSRDQIPIKKYLYTIRPLLCAEWIIANGTQPPMLYLELLDALHKNTPIAARIKQLVAQKQNMDEADVVEPVRILDEWVEMTMAFVDDNVPSKEELPDWADYERIFRVMINTAGFGSK